jgi:hypothetical protein
MALVHDGVSCDVCGEAPLRGVRYRCAMCSDFDVCDRCVDGPGSSKGSHDDSHIFLRISRLDAALASYPIVVNRSGLQHVGVQCACCRAEGFTGYRYTCQVCPGVDLCEACELKGAHDPSHSRLKIGTAGPAREAMAPVSTPAEVSGTSAGAAALQGSPGPTSFLAPSASQQGAGLPLCADCRGAQKPAFPAAAAAAPQRSTAEGFTFGGMVIAPAAFGQTEGTLSSSPSFGGASAAPTFGSGGFVFPPSFGSVSAAPTFGGGGFGFGGSTSSGGGPTAYSADPTRRDSCAVCDCTLAASAAHERQTLACGHAFHKRCLVPRLRHTHACPVPTCRQEVTACLLCGASLAAAPADPRSALFESSHRYRRVS